MRPAREADNLPSVISGSRQSGILNISQPYVTPRPVTEMALRLLAVFIVCIVSCSVCVVLLERGVSFCVTCIFVCCVLL
jgi:hypothetical protein